MTIIPPITNPLGRAWDQPSLSAILVDSTHAVMTRQTISQLKEYSASIPSGVYEGKCWRAVFPRDRRDFLFWYGPSENPDKCSINKREILLLD